MVRFKQKIFKRMAKYNKKKSPPENKKLRLKKINIEKHFLKNRENKNGYEKKRRKKIQKAVKKKIDQKVNLTSSQKSNRQIDKDK